MNSRSEEAVSLIRRAILSIFVLAVGFFTAQTTYAQEPTISGARAQQSASLTTDAPVYLLADDTRKPLRVLPAGTSLSVLRIEGDWVQVTFQDAQFGRRTGWIQREFVKLGSVQPLPPEGAPPTPEQQTRQTPPPSSTAAPREGLGFRGFGTVTFDKMTASESFKAITEKDTATFFGGGVQVTNLVQGLFVELGVERSSLDGERVFIGPNDEVFRLGIPLKITMTPIDVVAGWRSTPVARSSAYAAAGISFLKYEETSDFAGADENVSEQYKGLVVLGGIEYSAMRFVHIRGEVRYRRFGDTLGAGGVSAVFEETDLGSFGAALKIAVGR